MKGKEKWMLSAVLLIALLPAAALRSQTSLGTIRGIVTDPSGAAVLGADVSVRNLGTNIEHKTQTGSNGMYEVTHLVPGRYAVSAEHPGFRTAVSGVILETSTTVRIDLHLVVGEVTTAVDVEATAPLIHTEGAEVASIMTNRQILDTPVNYRGGAAQGYIYQAMVLAPGVQRAQGSNFSLAGARGHQWNASLDGTVIRSTIATSQSTMDATQELRIQLANDKAEASTPGGIYQTSKSGTNMVHGTAFYYHRNPRLSARDTFSPSVPFTLQHNLGGTVGGPIVKDRTFFFASYEGQRFRAENILNLNVPTLAMRGGDFSALPATTGVRDPFSGQPFPDRIIPASRLSPVSQRVQERGYPVPNAGPADTFQRNWQGTFPNITDRNQLDGRIDHRLSSANSLFARITWNRALRESISSPTWPAAEQDRRGTAITISNTHVFSPSLINEFRFGVGRSENPWTTATQGLELAQEFGLLGIAPDPVITVGVPAFTLTGFTSPTPTSGTFQSPSEASSHFVNNVTWIRDAHTVKTGVDLQRNVNTNFPGGSALLARQFGAFSFTGTYSGFSYADFLLGIPQTSSRSNAAPRYHLANTSLSFFLQDDWKVSRRLTLNLGVRYDLSPPAHERDSLFFNFDPSTGRIVVPNQNSLQRVNPLFPTDRVPIVVASEAGLPDNLFFSDRNNLVPRVGFAFRPFTAATTVIRGGYGMYTTFQTPGLYGTTVGGPYISDETFTNAITGGVPRFAFPQAFPEGFGAIGAQDFTAVVPRLRNPMLHQWSFTIERELWNTGFRVSYIGSHTSQLVWGANINVPPPSLTPFNNNRRPFPAVRNIILRQNGGNHQYNSLHVVAERKMKSGLYYHIGWTWGKNISDVQSDSEGGGQPQNSFARHLDRGDVNFMPRHRVVGTVLYDLPFGPGRPWLSGARGPAKWLLTGWSLSSVLVSQTGQFFHPTYSGFDVSNTNTLSGRPDRIGDGNLPKSERTLDRWFDAGAFRVPGDLTGDGRPDVAVGRFGNSGPNVLEGPGRFYISSGLFKSFSLTERVKATILGTFTNVLNHPIYSPPLANISAPGSVGSIRSSAANEPMTTSRQGQVGLRIEF